MNAILRLLDRVEKVCELLTSTLMLAIMLIVFCDVVMRYAFNSPLQWAFDLVGLYLMSGVFFLSLSRTYANHGHVGVDVLLYHLPPVGRRLSEMLTCIVAIPVFALMVKVAGERAAENWANNDALSGLIPWPMWLSSALVPVGAGLLVLRLCAHLLGHFISIALRKDVVPIAALPGVEDSE